MGNFDTLCKQLVSKLNASGTYDHSKNPPIFILRVGDKILPTEIRLIEVDPQAAYSPIVIHLICFLSATPFVDAHIEHILKESRYKWTQLLSPLGSFFYALTAFSDPELEELQNAIHLLRLRNKSVQQKFHKTYPAVLDASRRNNLTP